MVRASGCVSVCDQVIQSHECARNHCPSKSFINWDVLDILGVIS